MGPEAERFAIASTLFTLEQKLVSTTGASPVRVRGTSTPDRYETRGVLGEGGMGIVERVWDVDLMRELAVKRIRPSLDTDARVVAQFLWEARVTAHLDHPNIVPLHDLGLTDEQHLYFTMRNVIGVPLDRALDALRDGDSEMVKRLTLPRRLRIFLGVCHAVAFAHARGVVHRDLKPANVMLGDHGEVLVMDWGLAALLDNDAGRALRAVMPDGVQSSSAGTPLYMAPEQTRGVAVDERADVYSLGVALYEMIALAPPFEGASVVELLANAAAGGSRPLPEAAPHASPSLCAVVARAMAVRPEDRYASARELAEDIERVIDGRTPNAERADVVTRAVRVYGSRSKTLAQLRLIDFELWFLGCALAGAAVGAWLGSWVGPWAWALAVAGALACIPPTVRWIRALRAPDDGA